MCLAIPSRVTRVDGEWAEVEVYGNVRRVNLLLTPEAGVGDWVLVHVGCAIQVVDGEEARETLRLLTAAYGEGYRGAAE